VVAVVTVLIRGSNRCGEFGVLYTTRSNHKWSPWEGETIRGRFVYTVYITFRFSCANTTAIRVWGLTIYLLKCKHRSYSLKAFFNWSCNRECSLMIWNEFWFCKRGFDQNCVSVQVIPLYTGTNISFSVLFHCHYLVHIWNNDNVPTVRSGFHLASLLFFMSVCLQPEMERSRDVCARSLRAVKCFRQEVDCVRVYTIL